MSVWLHNPITLSGDVEKHLLMLPVDFLFWPNQGLHNKLKTVVLRTGYFKFMFLFNKYEKLIFICDFVMFVLSH